MRAGNSDHHWRFFRSGGFDQVQLDRAEDWQHLDALDAKLWAALSCPLSGVVFDARTLAHVDSDHDGRIRVPELRSAVDWACARLKTPQPLLDAGELALADINDSDDEGRQLKRAAEQLLRNLGASGRPTLSEADTADRARMFPPAEPNGDGIVPLAMAGNDAAKALIQAVIDTQGAVTDRSGEPGISADGLQAFVDQAQQWLSWQQSGTDSAQLPLGEHTAAAEAALAAVSEKIDDYFTRCRLAGFDARASAAMNGRDEDFIALAALTLSSANEQLRRLPLARISATASLPLNSGINPGWQSEIAAFVQHVVTPLLGVRAELGVEDWLAVQARFAAYRAWRSAEPDVAVKKIDAAVLPALISDDAQAAVRALIDADLAVKSEADAMDSVDKLVRYVRHLKSLLNNMVSFADFYTRRDKAMFQFGTLYIDGRACELVLKVGDAGKHAALAAHSGAYLVYCDCTRQGSSEKVSIVAAVTAGTSGNLMVGRNGVFFDREGRDWDATVTKIIENPISVKEAFWTPYRRVAKLIGDQAQKMAAARDKAVEEKAAGGVTATAAKVDAAEKPAAAPAPFDVAKFAGIFAAIGLAIGAIGTAIASIVAGFLSLVWWQMPLALAGLLLVISGPAMIMAWFKLRARNLGPLLDANGWAVNTRAKLTIAFGRALTQNAQLPAGSERSHSDPYAEAGAPWGWIIFLLFAVIAGGLWYEGYLSRWFGM